eukprot:CAMPEP_0170198266 /NCGR_PEP_ID=MMETSP0040_2-20121228/68460_1 /TAXON_ID=641309 /ORGANISM="Lotharella oceanica, Strain CCMP622" /LENGTH=61 /DNA_ID=CAMNT_0010448177 /DNA_START=34 /DNA_END=219 /DNA_ORIENTATION=-
MSVEGALLATVSGILIVGGGALALDEPIAKVCRVAVGGGALMLGLYIWAPAAMRAGWMHAG